MQSLDTEGFFERYPDAVAVLDVDSGTILAANSQCARLCDRPRESLSGESLSALSPDGWTPRTHIDTLVQRARNGRTTFDWQIERPDGTAVPLRCSMRRLSEDGSGRVLVTVRERAEHSPREEATANTRSDRELQELIDGMNDAVLVVDSDGNYIDANRVATERLGYTRAELLSMGPADISPPDHAQQVDERLRKVEEHETLVFESVQVTACDTEIPVEINASRITYRGEPAVLSVVRDISERKEQTRKLKTLEQAVEQAGHGVYITDTDGTIEYVNPAFEAITGYTESEAVGQTPSILSSGTHSEDYYSELWETLLAGDVWEEEVENERADGERYYADQIIAPIVEDGEVVRFVAIQQDVTERKERENKLERYEQLIENVPVGVYRNSPGLAGMFEEVNPAMVEMFGAESEAALRDTPVAELYQTPSQREIFSRKLNAENRVVDEELRLRTLDGERFWGAVTAIKHDVDGTVYYDGIIQDITERREKERELRLREQRFRRLFEDHNAPMLLIDPDSGTIERANDAAVEFYGYDRSVLTSMTIQEINQAADEKVAQLRQAADEQEDNRFIFPHELADGEIRQVEVDSSPIHNGGKRRLFSIIHDVTEREATRQKLERQNEQLELLNRVVRHDIRNDMSVVIGHAEILDDHIDDEGQDYLDTLQEHSEHVVELTKTARELMQTMLEDGASELGAVDLNRVLKGAVEEIEAGYEDAEFIIETPLPNAKVTGNEMLSSVFRNILNNAVQHNDKDVPRVTITAEADDDSVVTHIADNGPGVPDAQKEEIFGKGAQGMDSAGTGLGLHLVHTFVKQFGGRVWVTDRKQYSAAGNRSQSLDPNGTVFHIELPAVE